MNPALQDTLLRLFEQVHHDPDSLPTIPIEEWQEGSTERQLLISFSIMMEQVQQRIYQLREAEEQLSEREEQYRAIFEATIDGLSINDLEDGRVIEANPALCKMFGYTYEEFINLPPTATIHPDTYHVVDEVLQKVQTGSQFQTHFVALRKDGTAFNAEGRGTPFIYKGKPHLLGSIRDITEQVQAEEQLREREEQYRSIFEATSDALLIGDLEDGHVVEVNPAACKMYGYSYEEFIGLAADAITHPDSLSLLPEALQTIREGHQLHIQGLGLRKDGIPFHVEARGTPFTYKGTPHLLTVAHDISDRVEAERQLREQEEQYRSVFEATYDGINILDMDGFLVEVNPAFCSMFGYSREELIGRHVNVLAAPVDQHILTESLETLKAGRDFQTPVARGLRKDGTTFSVESHSTTFTFGGNLHLLAVSRNITERVEAERQLQEREEQYRSVFEATDDGLVIQDLEGFFIEVNPAFCHILGYTHEELIGLHYSRVTYPEYYPVVEENTQRVQAEGRAQAQGFAQRKDGSSLPVEAHSTSFTYKGKPHVLGVMRDITERVEAEEQLREREEQYRAIFEATYDALFIMDLDGFLVEANPAFCRMFGYSYEEVIGLHSSVFAAPVSLPGLADALKTLNTGRGTQTVVGQGLRKDGTAFYNESQSATFTFRGKPHALGVVRDITERVEAEQQLREREEQYRSIFEATYDGLIISDIDGYIVEVNPAFCGMYGYNREELIGVHSSDLAAPEYLTALDEVLETLKAGRNYQTVVAQSLRKDGTRFYTESHGTTLTYRGKPHALGIVRDITEQVQAQQLLEQRVEERTRELASLLEISHTVASTLQLKPLLGLILDQLKTVVDYTGSSILTVEEKELVILDSRSPTSEEQLMQLRFPLKNLGLIWETITSGESIVMQDVREETLLTRAFRVAIGELGETTFHYVRACMIVPLSLREQVIGMLVLTSREEQAFTQHHATLALAIANQAAVAIENARLYAQAQELAAVEERQRLARELHDSVSQALYGISLGVHTARLQLDRDPKELAESLDYVLELAEAALIEMRALIFELRPESLETEGLVTALTKQAAALHARQNITVNTDLCAEPDLPLKVKQDLYRIAQEALHNTVKHAHASKIVLRLNQTREAVTLEVCDNGMGFDATASFPGHLGLHSMQERVTGLGGELQIESIPGQGTCIRVQVPKPEAM